MFRTAVVLAAFLLAITAGAIADRWRWTNLPSPKSRIGCIDGLRGYLALAVMFHHFVVWLGVLQGRPWEAPSNYIFQNFGQGAVALFFMVTGALFYNKMISDGFAKVDWRALYISRAFRLVPLFWFVFLLVNLIIFIRQGFRFPTTWSEYASAAAAWMLFISMPPLGGYADSFRIVAAAPWTLPYEWICYFTLPFAAAVLGIANRSIDRLIILGALVSLSAYATGIWSIFGHIGRSFSFAIPFFLGMIAMEIARQPLLRRLLVSPWAAIIGSGALAVEMTVFPNSFAFIPFIVLAVFFAPAVAGNSYFGLLSTRASMVLGEASYGIYLLHGIVLYIALVDAEPLMSAYGPVLFWAGLPLLVVIVVLAAIAAHELIEKPAIRAGKLLARSRFAGQRRPHVADG